MHFPGILRFWEPPRSLSKALITQVKHWEWFASQISWVHIRFEYKKEKRNWSCLPLLPFSVKTEHFQFFSYLFRIVHYFNSQHPVSKSPAETTCKTQQFPDCKCHETLVLCSRQTSQLIKMHWWEKETTGKSRALGPSQGRKWKNKTYCTKQTYCTIRYNSPVETNSWWIEIWDDFPVSSHWTSEVGVQSLVLVEMWLLRQPRKGSRHPALPCQETSAALGDATSP